MCFIHEKRKLGGLKSVIYTDTVQVIIMITGALITSILGLKEIGGISELFHRYAELSYTNITNSCSIPPRDSLSLYRKDLESPFPATAVFMRMIFGGLFYWCSHQTIVQRALAARNINHAKGGTILAGFLKLLPFLLIVIPGMTSRVLYSGKNKNYCLNRIYYILL